MTLIQEGLHYPDNVISIDIKSSYEKCPLTQPTPSATIIYCTINPSQTLFKATYTLKDPNITQSLCRICYEPGTKENELLAPCNCEGTMKYIHYQCLKKWLIEQKASHQEPQCEICQKQYSFDYKHTMVFNKDKFKKYRCKTLIIIGLFTLIMLLGGILIWFCLQRYNFDPKAKKEVALIVSFSLVIIYLALVYSVLYSVRRKCYEMITEIVNVNLSSANPEDIKQKIAIA